MNYELRKLTVSDGMNIYKMLQELQYDRQNVTRDMVQFY